MRALALPLLLLAAACGDDALPAGDAAVGPTPLGTCGEVERYPLLASPHQDPVEPDAWNSNPPTSGPHSPAWAAWDQYYAELARDHWVHNLEHGGVVIGYRCDADCPATVAELRAIVAALPPDDRCSAPLTHRALLVADPLLPDGVAVAASAWGVAYRGTCVDADALRDFYLANLGRASEDTCANGLPFTGVPLE